MKFRRETLYLLVIQLLISTPLLGQQYTKFIQPNKIWVYRYYFDDGPCAGCYASEITVKYYFSGDTIIDNKVYSKLYGEIDPFHAFWGSQDPIYLASLQREDTVNQKVYINYSLNQFENCEHYNTEEVLYDFSVNPGDTVKYRSHVGCDQGYLIAGQIDSIKLGNGKNVRRYRTQHGEEYLIESIGSNMISFEPRWRDAMAYGNRIYCVRENGINLYQYDSMCQGITSIPKRYLTRDDFSIEYDQYSSTINIISKSVGTVKLFDLFGREILSSKVSIGNNSLAISKMALNYGVYIYHFSNKVGSSISGKLLIPY